MQTINNFIIKAFAGAALALCCVPLAIRAQEPGKSADTKVTIVISQNGQTKTFSGSPDEIPEEFKFYGDSSSRQQLNFSFDFDSQSFREKVQKDIEKQLQIFDDPGGFGGLFDKGDESDFFRFFNEEEMKEFGENMRLFKENMENFGREMESMKGLNFDGTDKPFYFFRMDTLQKRKFGFNITDFSEDQWLKEELKDIAPDKVVKVDISRNVQPDENGRMKERKKVRIIYLDEEGQQEVIEKVLEEFYEKKEGEQLLFFEGNPRGEKNFNFENSDFFNIKPEEADFFKEFALADRIIKVIVCSSFPLWSALEKPQAPGDFFIEKEPDIVIEQKNEAIDQEGEENEMPDNLFGLSLYPNPNNGRFTLNFSLRNPGFTVISIIDTFGKEIYHEALSNFSGDYKGEVNLDVEKTGLYILRIVQDGKVFTRQILID